MVCHVMNGDGSDGQGHFFFFKSLLFFAMNINLISFIRKGIPLCSGDSSMESDLRGHVVRMD